MFSLPPTALADILANVSDIFAAVAPVVALVVGVYLGLYIIGKIIDMAQEDRRRSEEVARVLQETDDLVKL